MVDRLSEDPEDIHRGGDVGLALRMAPVTGGRAGVGRGDGAPAREIAIIEAAMRTTQTAVTFEKIADHLTHVPGRKALIWVSAGIPMTIDGIYYAPYPESALNRLNKSDTAIYAIDVAGLTLVPHVTGSQLEFSRRTGGVAFHDRNDLDVCMRTALEDMTVSYTLGFHAPQDVKTGGHAIDVKVNRPHIKLRYRESYDPSVTAH